MFVADTLDLQMPTPLKQAARYRAHAAACLTNAEAAPDEATRRAHLAVAKHFYALAEQEIRQREANRLGLNALPPTAPAMADAK
jgi:hypothetical protein